MLECNILEDDQENFRFEDDYKFCKSSLGYHWVAPLMLCSSLLLDKATPKKLTPQSSKMSEQKVKKKTVKELNEIVDTIDKRIDALEKILKGAKLFESVDGEAVLKKNHIIEEEVEIKKKIYTVEQNIEEIEAKIKVLGEKLMVKDVAKKIKCNICEFESVEEDEIKKHKVLKHGRTKKCNVCNEQFNQNWQLEEHLVLHQTEKAYKCDECDKSFYLEWRMNKHKEGHASIDLKFCHYFNNNKHCPYENIACKFQHKDSPKCKYNENCRNKLCQYKHDTEEPNNDDLKETIETEPEIAYMNTTLEDEEDEKEWKFACQYCTYSNVDEDIFDEHMKEVHNQ